MGGHVATRGVTMPYMPSKKPSKPSAGKYKPYRAVRIPERMAVLLEELAGEDFNTLSDQVRDACRDRLMARGKLPRPSPPAS